MQNSRVSHSDKGGFRGSTYAGFPLLVGILSSHQERLCRGQSSRVALHQPQTGHPEIGEGFARESRSVPNRCSGAAVTGVVTNVVSTAKLTNLRREGGCETPQAEIAQGVVTPGGLFAPGSNLLRCQVHRCSIKILTTCTSEALDLSSGLAGSLLSRRQPSSSF